MSHWHTLADGTEEYQLSDSDEPLVEPGSDDQPSQMDNKSYWSQLEAGPRDRRISAIRSEQAIHE